MCPRHGRLFAGWLYVVAVAAVAANSEETIYREVGSEVALKPTADSVTATTKIILWKEGVHLAITWEDENITPYRQFRERGWLNTSTGVMTITGLIRSDSGVYTAEIDGKPGTPLRLTVISAVPVPTIKKSCEEETRCELTCDGDTTEAEPVTYKWKLDNKDTADFSKKHYTIKRSQENISNIKEFSCELANPVSQRSSVPISNPFHTEPERNLSISTGVTVFICLLLPLLLLALFHKYKTSDGAVSHPHI